MPLKSTRSLKPKIQVKSFKSLCDITKALVVLIVFLLIQVEKKLLTTSKRILKERKNTKLAVKQEKEFDEIRNLLGQTGIKGTTELFLLHLALDLSVVKSLIFNR